MTVRPYRASVLKEPAASVPWQTRRRFGHGQSVRAGDIVLSGASTRPGESPSGSRIAAAFDPFGSVAITDT
jgi:2-keto-4-pentenoate hydratase